MLAKRQIPNALTMARLVLAAAFFAVLHVYSFGPGAALSWHLPTALVLFIVAAATDALDGHLARTWKVESMFGRVMDPFCDKVLILGALIFLAGPGFAYAVLVPAGEMAASESRVRMVSGVWPWMVVVVLGRELLVTGLRGQMEGQGVAFGANRWGKWKMILQSVVVPAVLIVVMLDPTREGWGWLAWVRDGLVWLTVAVTVFSGWPYVQAARGAMK